MALLLALTPALWAAPALPWTADPALRVEAAALRALPRRLPIYSVSLDDPPATRWDHVAPDFKQYAGSVRAYLLEVVPAWALPIVEHVAANIVDYFGEAGEEMKGVSQAMGFRLGDVVVLNLIMQVEGLGLNCSNWNNTGPTRRDDPGCVAVDPTQKWCYCRAAHRAGAISADGVATVVASRAEHGPGLCTSVVAQAADGRTIHGRNLDWNIPVAVRQLLLDVNFTRYNKATSATETVFLGTGGIGFAGVFNGMRRAVTAGGVDGYSVSIDARGKGGRLLDNLLQALLRKSETPSQHLRRVFETESTFEGAISALSTGAQIDENYFIVAGAADGEGAVVARGRQKAEDVWRLNASEPSGWFRLQTNYDHWNPVPTADDRRTPGVAHMNALGRSNVTVGSVRSVMSMWPTFNHHTDYQGVYDPRGGVYYSVAFGEHAAGEA